MCRIIATSWYLWAHCKPTLTTDYRTSACDIDAHCHSNYGTAIVNRQGKHACQARGPLHHPSPSTIKHEQGKRS
jgi:hypothetical protein